MWALEGWPPTVVASSAGAVGLAEIPALRLGHTQPMGVPIDLCVYPADL
jgi:hypothetical protein